MKADSEYLPIDQREQSGVRAWILVRSSDLNKKKEQKTESQLEACQAFVATMGWKLLGVTDERVSGYKRVKRPLLEDIQRMMQRGEIDVVVATELERLSRTPRGQQALLAEAERWGCEFRLVEFASQRGKLPEGFEAGAYLAMRQLFGAMERQKIIERTERGRATRAAKRIPGGGNLGAPYGYKFVYPQGVDGRRATHIALEVVEEEAEHVRWLFQQVDEHEQLTLRSLVVHLNSTSVPTRGKGLWTVKAVTDKLRNPLYCGRAEVLRWQSVTTQERDASGEVHDVTRNKRRAPEDVLLAAEGVAPAIVSLEQFQRVQVRLEERRAYSGRLGRSNSTHAPEATLLGQGIARCAHCGGALTRYWRQPKGSGREPVAMYHCNRTGNSPQYPCRSHSIAAAEVDDLTLRLVATALSDPQRVLELAEASGVQLSRAVEDMERNAGRLADIKQRQAALEATRKVYEKHRLSMQSLGDTQMADMYSERLSQVAAEQAELETEIETIGPQQSRVAQRAAFLQALSGVQSLSLDFKEGTAKVEYSNILRRTLAADVAVRLLGEASPGEQLNTYLQSQGQSPLPSDEAEALAEEHLVATGQWDIFTPEVLVQLMRKAPYANVRRLLKELGVIVKISRPRGKGQGYTAVSERVAVELFSSSQQAALTLRATDTPSESQNTTCV